MLSITGYTFSPGLKFKNDKSDKFKSANLLLYSEVIISRTSLLSPTATGNLISANGN